MVAAGSQKGHCIIRVKLHNDTNPSKIVAVNAYIHNITLQTIKYCTYLTLASSYVQYIYIRYVCVIVFFFLKQKQYSLVIRRRKASSYMIIHRFNRLGLNITVVVPELWKFGIPAPFADYNKKTAGLMAQLSAG